MPSSGPAFRRPWRRPGLVGVCLLALALAGLAAARARGESKTLRLTVHIKQLRSDRGRLAVALFTDPRDFPDQKRALRGKLVRIVRRQATAVFADLRPGTYAVAVLHDENENGKMDFNWLGMPLEGYGFSRDAMGLLGPPAFEDAALAVRVDSSAAIRTRYFEL